uniref:Histone-lysine N-methyltransferase NSD3 n=1 Tax=Sander lucioperca TaxID=283035 RepID=A0A8C9YYD4_SANLU
CRSPTMDFSFSFMQGIMGNTIQQPPQLIDSANIRQEGTCDTGSDPGEDGGPSYDAALDAEFPYPPTASEDMSQVTNGYPPGLGITPVGVLKKTSSPEIKLKIIKTYQNGKELFESALCGDLLQELQKEKRKKSVRLQLQVQEQNLDQSQAEVPKVHHPSVIQETGFCKEFVIGDLVWSKVGTYPWWPCMVSSDPQMKVHTRINTRGHKRHCHREYHVQFFGSVAERAWIHEKRIVLYQGKQQFDDLQAETLRKATNPVEKSKLLKPIPQRERSQWEVGVGHAEDAFVMTRQERIDNYTFIYVDPDPHEGTSSKKPNIRAEKRNRRSSGSTSKKEEGGVKSPEREQPPRRLLPRRQCSVSNTDDNTNSQASNEEKNQRGDQRKTSSPKPSAGRDARAHEIHLFLFFIAPLCEHLGASEISDACKPLKKRSRASTDVEMASSQYRDTSDSDSRGLNDPQVGLENMYRNTYTHAKRKILAFSCTQNMYKHTVHLESKGLVVCEGDCNRQFHLDCLGVTSLPEGRFTCLECRNGNHTCFSCKTAGREVTRCSVSGCGCYYHKDCVRKLPGTTNSSDGGFCCPQHSCSTCCLERDLQRASKGRLMRCIRCPVAYHTGDSCVAAGSVALTHHIMICSSHSSTKRNGLLTSPINVGWCFLCARGGKLLCCDTCPASFHPECLEMEMPEGAWSCSDCRAGKKPHYKQIVWVKLGNYRWWPAEICNPRLVPSNIQSLRHDVGDFPVFFFGSHDYYWINQGRVFPYVENDKNFVTGQININKTFKKALEEAARRFQELKAQRESREALEQERNSRKPPPYKFIKSNKPVGKVQVHVADLSEIPRCNCRPSDEHPCSLHSQCLNRMLQYECHPQVCPAGDNCENQCFSKRLYAETEVIKTDGRGWGLRTNQALRKGDFVTEYVGEVIDSEECQQRIKRAHENQVANFYMLTLTKDRVIDAGPKGNSSRFMNHSCSPNCETQKWTVNGDVRIGLFTLCDIDADTELTFNYNLHCVGNRRSSCHCGSDNCSGFLGVQPTSAVVMEKEEKARNAKLKPKKRKLRLEGKHVHEYFCFCCGEGGELVMCDRKDCPKAYHLLCLNLTKPPYGRWECPWHDCSVCGAPASSLCDFCPRSYCRDHEAGALTSSSLEGRPCCSSHNPISPLGSNSSSTKPRRSALSPVSVKEEPEAEAGQLASE